MPDLAPDQFGDFVQAAHGFEPFEWQKRLAKEVLQESGWHDVIRVPTACGKTTVLDLAVFELALQAGLEPNRRTAGRRTCFVIDRRLVVDEVTAHAREIVAAIHAAARGTRVEPTLKAVTQRLATLAADASDPLRVIRLRGGVYLDEGWAADPVTPTILVSTVDQIGSRLLFRGYGLGPRSRPTHAGLLSWDTRIILDEAHLSTVFAASVGRIREYQRWVQRSPLPHERRVTIVRMSATAGSGERVFELLDSERQDDRLRPRLDAHKPADLVEVDVESITKTARQGQPRKARELEKLNGEKLVLKLAEKAKQVAGSTDSTDSDAPCVIGVVANRVATARSIFEALRESRPNERTRDAILLTGRIRPYDRDLLLEKWLPLVKAGREAGPERPLFVVATQTVEVGANLDFDALVTEAAPLDALRQRFGRLDRLGKRHERNLMSRAAVVIRSDRRSDSSDDRVYGAAVAETWKQLSKQFADRKVRGDSKRPVDFGVNYLDPKLKKVKEEDLAKMLAPQPDDPLLFPALVDAWVQTDPEPEPDPDVGPFLHGKADSAADVQIVWRADLDGATRASWRNIVALMPPRTREALPVPVYEARRWLRHESGTDVADIEGASAEDARWSEQGRARWALRWRGPDNQRTRPIGPDEVRPGDTIVVPASHGGTDEFGWNPTSLTPVADVAHECLVQVVASYLDEAFRRPKLRLRLHPSLLPKVDESTAVRVRWLLDAATGLAANRENPWPAVRQVLLAVKQQSQAPAWRAAVDALVQAKRPPQTRVYPGRDGLVVMAAVPVSLPQELAPPEERESDELVEDEVSLAAGGRPITLPDHSARVSRMAAEFAKSCGLDEELREALRLAGYWHDEGKRDRRFQAWLHGSEARALAALAAGQPLAKSGRDPWDWGRSETFGYPCGSRHEFVSAQLFDAGKRTWNLDAEADAELVKFLIGTHHGHGRPFVPAVKDTRPVNVALTRDGQRITVSSDHRLYRLDSGWPELFWRMVRRYGWWGLAYLEALVIAADSFVSAREQERKDEGGPAGV